MLPTVVLFDQSGIHKEPFPYRAKTFALIGKIAPDIERFSTRYNVYPIAVAGAIADEYNTRIRYGGILDWLQDDIVINWLPDRYISSDARLNHYALKCIGCPLDCKSEIIPG